MSDPASLATLDVLIKLVPPALFTDANLVCLAICRAVNLSLERGNSDGSCVAYVWLGTIAGPHFGDYQAGFRFAQLGYELVEKRGLEAISGPDLSMFWAFRHAMDETSAARPRPASAAHLMQRIRLATSPLRRTASTPLTRTFWRPEIRSLRYNGSRKWP